MSRNRLICLKIKIPPPRKNVDQVFARGKTVKVAVETKKKAGGLLNIKKPALGQACGAQAKTAAAIDTAKLIGKKTRPPPPRAKPAAPAPKSSAPIRRRT